ncbi:glycerol-3-phosphate 1-O-acyltransferase PlsY [Roseinatronobacter monicus]|uniref:Glycerol-3-phosphate acyltransferase n=1 Tax=Roseinatronobacter monicus TaxID=393481 RepID=A0A543KF79_9RHOB|nr:glycerol-3-phosphate 1-O-acyltransferase PlsY [Roseinatronobacter monicus]TQM93729.1 acyl-phosphate glycerol-3-phosphate acyltransferase [Roseinatronobacter monicus]
MPELLTPFWLLGLVGLAAYMLGSVPFGVVVARVMGLGDLRAIGSGNIGATNVMRTGNKLAGALTLALDAGKGAVAALIAWVAIGEDAAQAAALAAFLGHLYPVYLGFKGGKGVATFIGTAFALAWPVALAICAIWAVVFKLSRYSSLSALIASALSPALALAFGHGSMAALFAALTLMIFYKHSGNIRRFLAGTEPKFERKRP